MIIRVVNIRSHVATKFDHFCGRPSALGNPYSHLGLAHTLPASSRDDAIAKYRVWLDEILKMSGPAAYEMEYLLDRLRRDRELNLVCFCHPEACHTEVIREILVEA